MRKITLTILVLAALVLGLLSCENGAAPDADGVFNAVGTWKYVDVRTGLPATWDDRLVFKSDKTWERFYEGKLASPGFGTWDYADSWDKTSYGVSLLTGFGSRPKYIPYDPATKELVFDMSNNIERFKKQ